MGVVMADVGQCSLLGRRLKKSHSGRDLKTNHRY